MLLCDEGRIFLLQLSGREFEVGALEGENFPEYYLGCRNIDKKFVHATIKVVNDGSLLSILMNYFVEIRSYELVAPFCAIFTIASAWRMADSCRSYAISALRAPSRARLVLMRCSALAKTSSAVSCAS